MATIKPIEARSVHQIQSGQVIVDLCSVVKELVENSLDAGATSIDVRFKNYGLESIEVQDNGGGIAPEDHETIALKHYTSKLSTYDDLTSLQTFGFRGEALSSLCALSKFHIITARASDGPKGTRLDFEVSGKIKAKSVVASQKGTIVSVEDIFRNLPVRRRELEKNIKREYGKVLGLLHAYSCISTGVRFAVSNQPAKGKKVVVFSTKSNPTTRENISNVYGAKTILALISLDLTLEMHPTTASNQHTRNWNLQDDSPSRAVQLHGHISRPVVGEGRQTPDRQMFFVNSRPCALPQVAKAINEVYKGYNVTQSPFIFANLKMDTNAYDVNVSPDKRMILLHDQTALLEALKVSLLELFESHDQSVPQAAPLSTRKLPIFRPLTVDREGIVEPDVEVVDKEKLVVAKTKDHEVIFRNPPKSSGQTSSPDVVNPAGSVLRLFLTKDTEDRLEVDQADIAAAATSRRCGALKSGAADKCPMNAEAPEEPSTHFNKNVPRPVQDFNARLSVQVGEPRKLFTSFVSASRILDDAIPPAMVESEREGREGRETEKPDDEDRIRSVTNTPKKAVPGIVQNAFDRMRPKRAPQETAIITIGNQTTITRLGTPEAKRRRIHTPKFDLDGRRLTQPSPSFVKSLKSFAAPGTQLAAESSQESSDEDEDEDIEESDKIPIHNDKKEIPPFSMTVITKDCEILDLENVTEEGPANSALFLASDDLSDGEYLDEAEKKAREEAKVEKMIAQAEEAAARPTSDNMKRANTVLRGKTRKDSTLQLIQNLDTSVVRIEKVLSKLTDAMQTYAESKRAILKSGSEDTTAGDAEEKLSLTVSKSDFGEMRIVGQFNLGFILAMRPADPSVEPLTSQIKKSCYNDELFIIDQHASDEKFNFERLQAETVVQNQRLVHPQVLNLTAIEEEIIQNYTDVLAKNGYLVETDLSGDAPVGLRCRLVSLPMSREVVFNAQDLEELIAMLNEGAGSSGGHDVPRPSKIRKMFAMRACRSSVMVGKTLTKRQMQKIVTHMGEIDKPWNCPHGRPTMRHLFGMGQWSGWEEGDGLQGLGEDQSQRKTNWAEYARADKESGLLHEQEPQEKDPKE